MTSSTISLLSWNVSWGAMSGNIHDKTASRLVKHCKSITSKEFLQKNKYTLCGKRVFDVINSLLPDIVGLQEYPLSIHGLDPIYEQVVSNTKIKCPIYFNKNKFKLLYKKFGKIIYGRPLTCVILQSSKQYYLVINLHNAHSYKNVDLQEKLNEFTKDMIFPFTINTLIVLGDFNDENRKYYNGLHINVNNRKYKVFSNKKCLPKTCCAQSDNENHMFSCDYILTNLKHLERENFIPIKVYAASDHLPIATIIK